MSLPQILINAYVRPLVDYHENELPRASPAKLNADLSAGLMDWIKACAQRCPVGSLGPDLWYQVTALCYRLLVHANPAGVRDIAEIYAAQLPEIFAAELSIGDKLSVYDMLKHFFAMSAKDYAGLLAFDRTVVRPYAEWIRGLDSARQSPPPARPVPSGRQLRVGYFCNYAVDLAPGKPAAPLFISMIFDHREHFDHELIVYTPSAPTADWAGRFGALGITVRPLAFTGYAARGDVGLPESLERVRRDQLDIILTDDNLAMPTYLYEHRVAPVQVYVAMGMAFWGIRHLDHILTGPVSVEKSGSDLPPERLLPGRICYHPRLLDQPGDPGAAAALRARIPAGHRIAGVFARFVKLSAEYLDVVGRILTANPELSLIVAGNGDPSLINRFIAGSAFADRVIFFEYDIDIFTYGPMIDFFLDSFPFPSGNSTREIQYFGKPVVSRHIDEFALFFTQSRDPELVAADADAYVGIAGRLARDPDYLAARSAVARDIGALDVRRGGNVDLLRALIVRSTQDLSAPAPPTADATRSASRA
jgi:predicted O-linked N-acetylglucosamine transferase (SPINDLY family)